MKRQADVGARSCALFLRAGWPKSRCAMLRDALRWSVIVSERGMAQCLEVQVDSGIGRKSVELTEIWPNPEQLLTNLCRDLSNWSQIDPFWGQLGLNKSFIWDIIGQRWPDIDKLFQIRPGQICGRTRPTCAKLGALSTDCGPMSAGIGPTSTRIGPIFARGWPNRDEAD